MIRWQIRNFFDQIAVTPHPVDAVDVGVEQRSERRLGWARRGALDGPGQVGLLEGRLRLLRAGEGQEVVQQHSHYL
jgi:hypothetical protein